LVGLLGRGISPAPRPLPTHRTTQHRETQTHTSMLRAGFEPAIPMFERPKSVLGLDRAATETGIVIVIHVNLNVVNTEFIGKLTN
jgi:hypothetical protein